jgi:hypothetical protein
MRTNPGHATPPWSQVVERIENRHPGVVPDKLSEVARVVGPVDEKDPVSRLGHAGEARNDAEGAPVELYRLPRAGPSSPVSDQALQCRPELFIRRVENVGAY